MADETKTASGFIARRPPSSYPLNSQQVLIKEASQYCGLRKGMPRAELMEAMRTCMPEFFRKHKEGHMPKESIKVYHSPHCDPCHEVMGLLNQGRFESNIDPDTEIDIIDVTSEEGFQEVAADGVDSVPSAKYKGKTCKLSIDREQEVVVIECEGEKGATPEK
ncbi:MAG: hypothetical protein WC455_13115 [Dehalococcoidia bacterium]|jgi:hypothetical protein